MCPPLFAAHRLNPPRDDRFFVKLLYAIIAIDGSDHPPPWLGGNNGYGSLLHFHGPLPVLITNLSSAIIAVDTQCFVLENVNMGAGAANGSSPVA